MKIALQVMSVLALILWFFGFIQAATTETDGLTIAFMMFVIVQNILTLVYLDNEGKQ